MKVDRLKAFRLKVLMGDNVFSDSPNTLVASVLRSRSGYEGGVGCCGELHSLQTEHLSRYRFTSSRETSPFGSAR